VFATIRRRISAAYLCLWRSSMNCSFWYSFAVRQLTLYNAQQQQQQHPSLAENTTAAGSFWNSFAVRQLTLYSDTCLLRNWRVSDFKFK
jgi:cyanate permease